MDKSKRVHLVFRLRDALNAMTLDDSDLLLQTFSVGSLPEGDFGRGPSLTQWLNETADEHLFELGQHLEVLDIEAASGATAPPPSEQPDPLLVFASHISTHRAFIGEVEKALATYRVVLFVAHDSIPMDALWEPEIAEALRTCHAGATFLHKGFHESAYCQQEVGWLLGRGVPIARLILGEDPKALLSSLQGKSVYGQPASAIAESLMDYLIVKTELHPQLATSLAAAMRVSPSFETTDHIWERMEQIERLTGAQCLELLLAAERQDQVYQASAGGWGGPPYRLAIADFLQQHDAAGVFAERIAEMRTKATTREHIVYAEDVDV